MILWYYERKLSNIKKTMKLFLVVLVIAVAAGTAQAHDLQHQIDEAAAVSVRLSFADGSDFAFESYEVYRSGDEILFQVGRTDLQGRIVFLPDRAGTWRIKAFSEEGHGTDFSFTTGAAGGVRDANKPFLERHLRIVVGVSVIFGAFGLVDLMMRRGWRS
jgi:nickel transport protein